MSAAEVLAIIQQVVPMAQIVRDLSGIHGFVHDRKEAEINGIRGFLVWDYILYNEITFDDYEGNVISFFTSWSNDETKAKWDELVGEYGIKRK